MVLVYKMLDPTSEHRVWAYTASTVTAPIDHFLCCPALVSEFGRFLFSVCSVCAHHLISCSHWLQTFSKLRAFWPSYLCSGIPFHSSNWQTEVFCFEDRSYGTVLVNYFQVKFQLFFAMPCCSILFVLSEQYSLSWRISIVVCPDVQGEGSRVSLEHLQSTVLRRASVTSTSIQARSQDLEKGGYFERGEKCKRPWPEFSLFLNQFHTVCPKIETKFLEKLGNSNVFSAQNQVVSKKEKKKVFTEIETDFSAKFGNSNVWGGAVFLWAGYFQFFTKNRPQKHQKRAILHTSQSNDGGLEPPPPPPGYATASISNIYCPNAIIKNSLS